MTRIAAQEVERKQLDAMLRLLGLDIDGEPVKRERPDFTFRLRDGRTIGIELVRAMKERIAAGRGSRARLIRGVDAGLADARLNAWVSISLHEKVAAMLNENAAALKREVAAVVQLARTTMSRTPDARWHNFEASRRRDRSMMGRERHDQSDVGDLEGTGIEHLDVVGIRPHPKPRVTWGQQGEGQQPNIVQNAIDGKVADLAEYRRCGADEIWLLVVGSAGTGGALFVDDVEDLVFVSPYDKTVFLELFEGRCMFLATTNSGPAVAT